MLSIKSTKLFKTALCGVLAVTTLVCYISTTAFASGTTDGKNEWANDGNIISHSEQWVTPIQCVETTVYDIGDGFTATVITTEEYNLSRASGTRTASQEVKLKEGATVAGTAKVTASFSYDGKLTCKVTSSTHSRTVKSGYSEESWNTSKYDYEDHMLANAISTLKVRNNSTGKTCSATAMVTCTPNG